MLRVLTTVLAAVGLLAVTGAVAQDAGFEIVAELQQPPGNVAVTPDGQIVFSQHQFYSPRERVVTVGPGGTVKPFPNETWSTPPEAGEPGLNAVLGVVADRRGRVWMLDNGGRTPRLVAWDTRDDDLHRIIPLPRPAVRAGSFPNDMAIDLVHQAIVIADFGGKPGPGLIVVDLETGYARRVLEGHATVVPEDRPMIIDDRKITVGTGPDAQPSRVGVNPIAMGPTNTWVYYGAMSGDDVWRVRIADLLDASLSKAELGERVERYGDKPISDGITIDAGGNVYITDITSGALGVTRPDGRYDILVDDPRIEWPDGFAAGPDGHVYVAINQLHKSPMLNKGSNTADPPFYIARFDALAPTVPGR